LPSAQTEIDVINRALLALGDRQITARTENNERARIMDAIYDGVRDMVLRECPWNFASKQVSIAKSATYTPVFDYGNAYALPADFLYMLRIKDDQEYRMQDNYILSDPVGSTSTSISIEYVRRITDMSTADSLFVEALSARLAYDACEKITQSNTKKDALRSEYEVTMTRAKRLNGQEDFPQSLVVDEWITARY
jgi:hypothetical protein